MNRHVSDEKRKKRLLIKINAFIRIKCVDVRNYEIDFYIKLVVNLLIAKQLFVNDEILKKSFDNVTKTNQHNQNNEKNENENDKKKTKKFRAIDFRILTAFRKTIKTIFLRRSIINEMIKKTKIETKISFFVLM